MSKKMQELADFGQSIWLDYIDRPLLESGKLDQMIADGLMGMTSNPSIFNNAIGSSNDYDEEIVALKTQGKSTFEIYDALTIKDIQNACDHFKCVYEQTNGRDGYVSLEINPQIAHEEQAQIDEGIRLHTEVNRPNLMVKVPSTEAGCKVIEALTAKGINVNATLIFCRHQYQEVALSYIRGLKELDENGGDLSKVHSVASIFVSRVDGSVDKLLNGKSGELMGTAAVANCRLAFNIAKDIFGSDEFKALLAKGANAQRVLWASTSTKNPEYNDVKYVEELLTPNTVNTIPANTLDAFLDHGVIAEAFGEIDPSKVIIDDLSALGINIDQVTEELLSAGVDAFAKAFGELFESIEKKAESLVS